MKNVKNVKNSETILPFSCCPFIYLWYEPFLLGMGVVFNILSTTPSTHQLTLQHFCDLSPCCPQLLSLVPRIWHQLCWSLTDQLLLHAPLLQLSTSTGRAWAPNHKRRWWKTINAHLWKGGVYGFGACFYGFLVVIVLVYPLSLSLSLSLAVWWWVGVGGASLSGGVGGFPSEGSRMGFLCLLKGGYGGWLLETT